MEESLRKILVNLFGAPSAGKSTAAHYITACLKMSGVHAEFTGEYAKDCAWEHKDFTVNDQIYVFGKQWHRLYTLDQCPDIEVIITDSPLLLSLCYNPYPWMKKPLIGLVEACSARFTNLNYWLDREGFEYESCGRFQSTHEESELVKNNILSVLKQHEIKAIHIAPGMESLSKAVDSILGHAMDLRTLKRIQKCYEA